MAAFDYNISVTGDCTNSSLGAITLSLTGGTPPYTIEFISPYTASFIDTIDPVTVTGLYSDVYIVRVNDSTLPLNGEFFINIPISSGVCGEILEVQNTKCGDSNGLVITTSSSEYSSTEYYLYTTSDEFVSSAITNTSQVEFASLSAGTYYLIVQDLGGCSGKTQDFIVEESNPLDFGLYVVPNSSCTPEPLGKIYITGLTGTPPYTYLWSNSLTGSSITGLTSGLYSVTVTDSLGCQLGKTGTVVDVDPVGFGQFIATPPTCFANNGTLSLVITGGTEPYYYSASTGYFEISYSQTFTLTGLSAGQYTIDVTDAALCRFSASSFLASPDGMTVVTVNTTNSTCSSVDGSIFVGVEGGSSPYIYTLVYPDSSTQNVTSPNLNYTFENLSGGTYTVFVQDANACQYSEEVIIIAEDKFSYTTNITGTTCNLNNGVFSVTMGTGYTLPLTYSLDEFEYYVDTNLTAVTFSNVSKGSHILNVTDATGCSIQRTIFVSSSEPLVFSLFSTSCGNGNNGTVTTFISSGNPPFTFDWSDNVESNPQQIQVTGLTAGTYSVTVTDSTGCSLSASTTIECNSLYSSYQTYVMGQDEFVIDSPTKCGIQQMFNEGFQDLIDENSGCSLVSATFTAKVSVIPLGFYNSNAFYYSMSLSSFPSDQDWYSTITDLINTIPGVGGVQIDQTNNLITIKSQPDNSILNGQQILVELLINYDINCQS